MLCGMWLRQAVSVFFEYDTPKIVHIKSKRIGILSRLVQSCVLAYVIGYVLVYNKGYQEVDEVVSAVTSKVKGTIYTNFTESELDGVSDPAWRQLYNRIWDVTDIVVPPVENNAFFLTTNVVITPNQQRDECAESRELAPCSKNADCPAGEAASNLASGVNTGKCNSSTGSCEIFAWCPLEEDKLPRSRGGILADTRNFTVLIKNQIGFPKFSLGRTNILDTQNASYLAECVYSPATDPLCPVFRIGDMADAVGANWTELALFGGVISIGISWDCDLDTDFLTNCKPNYSFRRLDNPRAKIAPGWNFRHADYFNENRRTLYKAYGINFVVNVWGRAGKFNLIPTLLNLGAGLALLSVATLVCDIVVLYLMKNGDFYKRKKYLEVKAEDAFAIFQPLNDDWNENEERRSKMSEDSDS